MPPESPNRQWRHTVLLKIAQRCCFSTLSNCLSLIDNHFNYMIKVENLVPVRRYLCFYACGKVNINKEHEEATWQIF